MPIVKKNTQRPAGYHAVKRRLGDNNRAELYHFENSEDGNDDVNFNVHYEHGGKTHIDDYDDRFGRSLEPDDLDDMDNNQYQETYNEYFEEEEGDENLHSLHPINIRSGISPFFRREIDEAVSAKQNYAPVYSSRETERNLTQGSYKKYKYRERTDDKYYDEIIVERDLRHKASGYRYKGTRTGKDGSFTSSSQRRLKSEF